jgi:hypothetical protein
MVRSALLLLALGPVLASVLPAGAAEPDPEVKKLLAVVRRGEDTEAWREAVDALRARGGEDEAKLDRALCALVEKLRRARDAAAARLRAVAGRLSESESLARRRRAWEKARTAAIEWIFDKARFPDIDGRILSPQEGYTEAMVRAKAAIAGRRALLGSLEMSLAPLRRLDAKKARSLRDAYAVASADLARVERVAPAAPGERGPDPEIPRVALTLLDIVEGKLAEARRSFDAMPAGWPKLCVFEAYGRAVLARNAADAAGQGRAAVEAVAGLNAYRMALGISPLAHNPRLVRMAQGHATDMRTRGFFDHESPTPGRRTMRDRARLAGYEGRVEECITARNRPRTAIEVWQWDGGHHRILVTWRHVEVGCSDEGPITLNAGSGEPGSVRVIRY